MDFLEEAKKRAAASADCEIIDVEPLSIKVPEKVVKGKAVATMPQKMKRNMPPCLREKLIRDAFNTKTISESLDIGLDPARDTVTVGRFVLDWRLGRDTILVIMAERKE